MSKLSQYGDALERTLWTAAEGAGAVGLVAGWQAIDPLPDIPAGYVVLVTILVGALLAAGKGIVATNVGNGTASLGLPTSVEPVPAASVALTVARAVGNEQLIELEPDPRDDVNYDAVHDAVVDINDDGHDDRTGRFTGR